jgi:hypothetical protein
VNKTPSAISAACFGAALVSLVAPMTSPRADDVQVPETQCHGHPHWCVRVINVSDHAVEFYIDGARVGEVIGAGKLSWFVMPPGPHQVHACLVYLFSNKCLAPETVPADSDDSIEVHEQRN